MGHMHVNRVLISIHCPTFTLKLTLIRPNLLYTFLVIGEAG